jgi:NAD(P)-dependent dehydrogenase (short-subunit alcohol dehydrogenase family)
MIKENFNLAGKSVVITGATSGIGLAAATRFAQQGAFVIGVGRSETRNRQAQKTIMGTQPSGQIAFLLADLGDQQQVRNLGTTIHAMLEERGYDHLDILINNAGGYLENKRLNDDQIEMTFAVNHLAAFILTYQLFSLLKRSHNGRVITVSSYAHRTAPINLKRISNPWPYIGLLAYKRSKLCNILFTSELNRRSQDVEAFAVDPGLVNTGIGSKSKPGISNWVWKRRRHKGTDTDVPIETLLYLADHTQSDLSNGCYFRDCQPQTPSRTAKRQDLAYDLWQLSCQLTGIKWA